MIIMKKLFLYTILTCILVPYAAQAAVLRTGEDVSVTNEQEVHDDFYAAAEQVSSSGDIKGDFYAAAGSFTNNGSVDGDVVVIGGTVDLHAAVTDDVRIVGGEAVIAGPVAGDVVMVGGMLEILSTASVGGDVLFYGGDLKVLGAVEGSVLGGAEKMRIDAPVGGGIEVTTAFLTLGDRAEVLGDVSYTSPNELVRSQNAIVVGEVVKNSAPPVEVSYDNLIMTFVIVLFTALVLQLLLRPQLRKLAFVWTESTGVSGLVGVGVMILTPLAFVLALVSVLGAFLGVLLLLSFLLLVLFSCALMSIAVGTLISDLTQKNKEPNVLFTVLGAATLQAVLLLPILGVVLVLMAFLVTLGGIVLYLYRALRA